METNKECKIYLGECLRCKLIMELPLEKISGDGKSEIDRHNYKGELDFPFCSGKRMEIAPFAEVWDL